MSAADKTREEFEAWFTPVLDLTTKPDAWDRRVYAHEHVESIWHGWQAASASHEGEVKRLREALTNWIAALDTLADAMHDGLNVHGALAALDGAEAMARAALQGDKQ
jgi:hypothetical protein